MNKITEQKIVYHIINTIGIGFLLLGIEFTIFNYEKYLPHMYINDYADVFILLGIFISNVIGIILMIYANSIKDLITNANNNEN